MPLDDGKATCCVELSALELDEITLAADVEAVFEVEDEMLDDVSSTCTDEDALNEGEVDGTI